MTVVYGDDDDWPMWALEKRVSATDSKTALFRMFDDMSVYWLSVNASGTPEFISSERHGLGVVPVVRFLSKSWTWTKRSLAEVDDLPPPYRTRSTSPPSACW